MLIEIRDFDKISEFLNKLNYWFVEKFSINDYLFEYRNVDN